MVSFKKNKGHQEISEAHAQALTQRFVTTIKFFSRNEVNFT